MDLAFVKCPKCGELASMNGVTDGQSFTCPKCGCFTKAHNYRIYETKLGPARAEPCTGLD